MVSRKSGDNCKIRDDLMDIKRLKQINGDKLEQWCRSENLLPHAQGEH